MGLRKTIFQKNQYYHIYNRGANKENIFLCDENYLYLLRKIKKHSIEFNICVVAYCLMPNHYHFLLGQNDEIPISKCIQALFNSYSKAFNKMYKRSGTLFEGKFKSILVHSEEYLIYLCRYIHRNPIDGEKPLVKEISDWPYSNYLEWICKRNGSMVDYKFVKSYFERGEEYKAFVLDYTPPKDLSEKLRLYSLD